MKKEWIVGGIIFILLIGGVILINKNYLEPSSNEIIECEKDQDCVKASCCHATSCVSINKSPDCTGISCTFDCAANTLDCGQGSCLCVKNKCSAVYK